MSIIRYVLLVVVEPQSRTAVGLIKKKGPSFLIDKITFPGGKIEADEHPGDAASREMFEETGLHVPDTAWRFADVRKTDSMELFILAARSETVHRAVAREDEPVFQLHIEEHVALAHAHPERYSPDFLNVVSQSMTALDLQASKIAA